MTYKTMQLDTETGQIVLAEIASEGSAGNAPKAWDLTSAYSAGNTVTYTDGCAYIANGAVPANTPFAVGTTGATFRLFWSGSDGKLPAMDGSKLTGVTAAGAPSIFIPPGTGLSSTTSGAVSYDNTAGWSIKLQNSTATPISISCYQLPINPDAPFSSLPAQVTQTLTTAFTYSASTGLWTGVVTLTSSSTFSSQVANIGNSYAYGTIGGKSNAANIVGVTLVSVNGSTLVSNGTVQILAEYVDITNQNHHFIGYNYSATAQTCFGVSMPAYSVYWFVVNKNNGGGTAAISSTKIAETVYCGAAKIVSTTNVVLCLSPNAANQTVVIGTTSIASASGKFDRIFANYSLTTNTAIWNKMVMSTYTGVGAYGFELSPDATKIYVLLPPANAVFPGSSSSSSGGTTIPSFTSSYVFPVGLFALQLSDMGYVTNSAWIRDYNSTPTGFTVEVSRPAWDYASGYVIIAESGANYTSSIKPDFKQWSGTAWTSKFTYATSGTAGYSSALYYTIPISASLTPAVVYAATSNPTTGNTAAMPIFAKQNNAGVWFLFGHINTGTSVSTVTFSSSGANKTVSPAATTSGIGRVFFALSATISGSAFTLTNAIVGSTSDTGSNEAIYSTPGATAGIANSDGTITVAFVSQSQISFNGATLKASVTSGQCHLIFAKFDSTLKVISSLDYSTQTSNSSDKLISNGDLVLGAPSDNYMMVTGAYGYATKVAVL